MLQRSKTTSKLFYFILNNLHFWFLVELNKYLMRSSLFVQLVNIT